MKRIPFLLLILLLLASCAESLEQKLEKLGYSEEEILLIAQFDESEQERLLSAYDPLYVKYRKRTDCDPEKIDEYICFDSCFEDDKMIQLVNEGLLNENNVKKLQELYASEYYLPAKEELYLQYLEQYPSIREMIEIVNTGRYKPLFSDIQPVDMEKGDLILVNKYHQLAEDYVPEDLVNVDPTLGKGQLREKVYEAYKQLYEDAKKENMKLFIASSYRSYYYQRGLYEKYLKTDPQEKVDTYSARAGHSEHQTGMALDVVRPGYSMDDFYKTEEAKWIAENAHRYGFIVRYPADKIDITGYIEEPWHLRYLGKEIAEDVYEKGITYDEYYACYVE